MRPATLLLALSALVVLGLGALLLLGGDAGAAVEESTVVAAVPEPGGERDASAADLSGPTGVSAGPVGTGPRETRVQVPTAADQAAEAVEEEPQGPWLHGLVTDADGYPVAGAEVRVSSVGGRGGGFMVGLSALTPGEEDARTRDDGTFQVERGGFDDEVEVEVRARGYAILLEPRGIDTEEGDAWLGPMLLERAVVLGGKVVDAQGNPVEGATVRRTDLETDGWLSDLQEVQGRFGGESSNTVETDSEGRFELPHEEAGPYRLRVRHDLHPNASFDGEAPAPGLERTDLVLQLAPSGTIAGRILDFPEGREHCVVAARPLEDAEEVDEAGALAVFFESAGLTGTNTGDVAPDGTFAIHGLDPGAQYRVQAFVREGFIGRTAASDEKLTAGDVPQMELTWDPGASIAFRVRDASTEARLDEVTVRFRWEEREMGDFSGMTKTRSFEGGDVLIEELRPDPSPQTVELVVSSPGYLDERLTGVSVAADGKVDLGVVRLSKAATVKVTVVEAASGEPIRRARVWLRPEGGEGDDGPFSLSERLSSGKTDANGVAELAACATPTAQLEVWRSGYARSEQPGVTMPIQGVAEHRVALIVGGTVELEVRDTLGRPAQVPIRHERPDGSRNALSSNKKGKARVRNLTPGEHRFRAELPEAVRGAVRIELDADGEEAEDPWETVRVGDGAEVTLRLTIPASAQLTGVVRARGREVPHVSVAVIPGASQSATDEMRAELEERFAQFGNDSGARTRTDTRGRFELEEVPTGKHRLRISGGELPMAHFVPVEIRTGTNHVNVDLPLAALEGRVVDADGVGVPGARVRVARADAESGDGDELEDLAIVTTMFGGSSQGGQPARDDGSFVLEGVPSGVPVMVVASARGYIDGRSEPVTLSEDQVVGGLVLVLSSGGSLRVEVPEKTGPFVFATATYEGDLEPTPAPQVRMVRDGVALLRDLEPGPWRVKVQGFDDEETEGELVEVRAGEESIVRL